MDALEGFSLANTSGFIAFQAIRLGEVLRTKIRDREPLANVLTTQWATERVGITLID